VRNPILITGCARSGTSMIGGVVELCGGFGGKMFGPNKNNEKGMFENEYIRNQIVKPYLRSLGVDPLGQYPLPNRETLPIPIKLSRDVIESMQQQGLQDQPWFYKGAKMCLMWAAWNFAFPDAKWIIVRRKTPDIINSCMKTSFMNAFSLDKNKKAVKANSEYDGWLWWVRQHEDCFVEMIQAGLNVKVIYPERMVYGDYKQMQETIEWLGLKWNNEVYNFIAPKLWKSKG